MMNDVEKSRVVYCIGKIEEYTKNNYERLARDNNDVLLLLKSIRGILTATVNGRYKGDYNERRLG